MKRILFAAVCFFIIHESSAQYYYKDQIITGQTAQQLKKYKDQKIRKVTLASFEFDGQPSEGFSGEQSINNNFTEMSTLMQSPASAASELKTFYNATGQLIKTTDTTDGSGSLTTYTYTASGQPAIISNLSTSAGLGKEKEIHIWSFTSDGKPEKMLRVKNDYDTTYISFVLDENGNVAEENSRRKNVSLPSIYYYYDAQKQLTDIVTYNVKAKRLLPIYVFEYDEAGRTASMLVVPEGTDNYQKWQYAYNAAGLKTSESCYNKKKQLLGKIAYQYQ